MSHFGRPKGRRVPEMSLRPAAQRLAELMRVPVDLVGSTSDETAIEATRHFREGGVVLLENTRFDPREEENDPELAAEMAELGDLFVNDAFGAAHRAHASTAGVARRIRDAGGLAVAGLLMKRELDYLGDALAEPERPFVAILGGAKISGKIDVIEALLPKTDRLLIGGAMANTFFRAQGLDTGTSLVEEDSVSTARRLLEHAEGKLELPLDIVVARAIERGGEPQAVAIDAIPNGLMAVDIGPATVERYSDIIREARTVFWNGPMGVAEVPEFRKGTEGVAQALSAATRLGATTIVGGGDSAAALLDLDLQDQISHVSTGGGASLEFLEGRILPGVDALSDREAGT
ncbi:MAG: phosphoglycerate kinase [Gemmatimonadota bacterium]